VLHAALKIDPIRDIQHKLHGESVALSFSKQDPNATVSKMVYNFFQTGRQLIINSPTSEFSQAVSKMSLPQMDLNHIHLQYESMLALFFDSISSQTCPHLFLFVDDEMVFANSTLTQSTQTSTDETQQNNPNLDCDTALNMDYETNMNLVYNFFSLAHPGVNKTIQPLDQYSVHFSVISDLNQIQSVYTEMAQIAITERMTRYERYE
jgi:hypothetical protein